MNPNLNSLLGRVRHTNLWVVAVRGFPFCPEVETIAVEIAEPDGEVRSLGIIPNREESIRKLVKKLGPTEQLRACYEAGPTGYVLYWQLTALG